jgi:glucose 1-dehydrogenase
MSAANAADPLRPLKNQTAIVTGASSGIGEARAIALGAAGADTVVNYRSQRDEVERVVQTIERAGGKAIAVRADVSREQ